MSTPATDRPRRKFAEPLDWAMLASLVLHGLILALRFGSTGGGEQPADVAAAPMMILLPPPAVYPEPTPPTPAAPATPTSSPPPGEFTVTLARPVRAATSIDAPIAQPVGRKAVRKQARKPRLTVDKSNWKIAKAKTPASQAPARLPDAPASNDNVDVARDEQPVIQAAGNPSANPPEPATVIAKTEVDNQSGEAPELANIAASNVAHQQAEADARAEAEVKAKAEAARQQAAAQQQADEAARLTAQQAADQAAQQAAQAKAAEAVRLAQEKRAADEAAAAEQAKLVAEAATLQQQADAARKAAELQAAAERQRAEAALAEARQAQARLAEQQRQAAEAQARAEQTRLAAEAARAEQVRRQAEAARQAQLAAAGQEQDGDGNGGKGEGGSGVSSGPGIPLPLSPPAGLSLAERALQQLHEGNRQDLRPPRSRTARLTQPATAADIEFRFYAESWRLKVQRIGGFNAPHLPEGTLVGPLVLSVVVNRDGSLASAVIQQSSGNARVDDAARRIVQMSAPFSPFPPGMAQRYDQVEITRTWNFSGSETSLTY